MKLLLIVDDYLPCSIKVAAKMMHELACELIRQGHEVTVVTPSPELTTPCLVTELNGVKICQFKSGQLKNVNKIKRAINETLLSQKAWRNLNSFFNANPHDGIIYYSPSIFWGPLVKKLKKKWNCSSYLVLRDIFPQWTLDNGIMSKKSPIYAYFKFFEKLNYDAADCIGVMSPANLHFFEESRQDTSKFEVLYNWAISSKKIKESRITYRKKYGLEDKIVFFYGGNIGHAQDMMNMVRLAEQLKSEPSAHFLFVGKGDEVDLILEAKDELNLDNLTYLPPVDQENYTEMLSEFDVGLFSLHRDHTTHNFPGKLLGYMDAEIPILGSVNSGNDLKEILETGHAGLIAENGENDKLLENAKLLLADQSKRTKMGCAGKKLLERVFSVDKIAKQIADVLQESLVL